jgi:serine/threonine protein kinase
MPVDVEKYRASNPISPVDNIPDDAEVTLSGLGGKKGQSAHVYQAQVTGYKQQELLAKQGDIKNDGLIGEYIINKYNNIPTKSLVSGVQGLSLTVPGKLKKYQEASHIYPEASYILLQEKIKGAEGDRARAILTLWDSIEKNKFPYSKGYVDDPQKALKRLCGLVLALHSLHEQGITHGDFHPRNIMVERVPPPGCTDETELKKLEADQYEYRFRIIDFGRSSISNSKADTISDIKQLGGIIRKSLFGYKSMWSTNPKAVLGFSNQRLFIEKYQEIELQEQISEPGNEDLGDKLHEKLDELAKTREAKYREKIQKEISEIKSELRKSSNMKNVESRTKEKMDEYILDQFKIINEEMEKATGKSYPEPVLAVIAQIVKSCIIGKNYRCLFITRGELTDEDFFEKFPEEFPTAGEILEQLQNLAFSDWSKGKYEIEGYDNEY